MNDDRLKAFGVVTGAIVLMGLGTLPVQGGKGGGKGERTPAQATFGDRAGPPADKIRSDSGYPSPYQDGVDCVGSWIEHVSFYFLRTVKPNCSTTNPRFITLDFSDRLGGGPVNCEVLDPDAGVSLNICASQDVPDVRIIANSFSLEGVTTTPVNLPFNMTQGGDFYGLANFELTFEQNVPVVDGVMTADAGAGCQGAIAELYQNKPKARGKGTEKVSLGRYCMPFELAVAPQ